MKALRHIVVGLIVGLLIFGSTHVAAARVICEASDEVGWQAKCQAAANEICNCNGGNIPDLEGVCGLTQFHWVKNAKEYKPGSECGDNQPAGLIRSEDETYSRSTVTFWHPDVQCTPGYCDDPASRLAHELGHGRARAVLDFDHSTKTSPGTTCAYPGSEDASTRAQNAFRSLCPNGCCLPTRYGGCPTEDPYRHVNAVWNVTDYGQSWVDVDFASDNLCQQYETFDGNFSARRECAPHFAEGELSVSNNLLSGKGSAFASGSFHGASVSNTVHPVTGAGRPVRFNLAKQTLLRFLATGGGVGSSSFVRLYDSQTPPQTWEIGNGTTLLPAGDYSLSYRYNVCCNHDTYGDWQITACPTPP